MCSTDGAVRHRGQPGCSSGRGFIPTWSECDVSLQVPFIALPWMLRYAHMMMDALGVMNLSSRQGHVCRSIDTVRLGQDSHRASTPATVTLHCFTPSQPWIKAGQRIWQACIY
jgi:hypothetical protein